MRHARGVDVGTGEGVGVGWAVREAVGGMDVNVGVDWIDGEQAVIPARSASSTSIRFVA